MQEMLVPLTAYKEAYEQSEEKYADLKTKADVFKDLSNSLPDGSRAKAIYEGYANDLNAYAEDFAQHGLNMGNRSGLTKMKQRYQGEIGLLTEAKTKLEKELDLRRQMSAKDPSMLYALDNAELNIDSFLGGNTPNDYSISGDSLYAKGMAAGKAASSRIYSDPAVRKLDKHYNEYFSTIGYSPEKMQEFRDRLSAIPELQKAAMDIASANRIGELGEGSANYKAALQQIVNGIADGAIFQRQSNMQRDLSVMTAAEEAADLRDRQRIALQKSEADERKRQFNIALRKEGFNEKGDFVGIPSGETTKYGKPVYYDEYGRKYAWGSSKNNKNIRYYDDNGDGVYDKPYSVVDNKGKLIGSGSTAVPKEVTNLKNALLKLSDTQTSKTGNDYRKFKNDTGFSVQYKDSKGNQRTANYVYAGAIKASGNNYGSEDDWHHGKIGESSDRWFGMTSASNVIDWGGDYTATIGRPRVMTDDEMNQLVFSDPGFYHHLGELLDDFYKEHKGLTEDNTEYEILEVPNEYDGARSGYLVAVRKKD